MKPGMKPNNCQQISEKGMKPGMKPRYETGLSKKIFPHVCHQLTQKLIPIERAVAGARAADVRSGQEGEQMRASLLRTMENEAQCRGRHLV